MKKYLRGFLIGLIVAISTDGNAADPAIKSHVASYKGKSFVLKAHEELCGTSTRGWDGRFIQECDVTAQGETATIDDAANWKGAYFVSENSYVVKDVKVDVGRDRIQIKVWRSDSLLKLQPEIKFNFTKASQLSPEVFDRSFFQLFFRPNESRDEYISINNAALLEKYIDPEKELFLLPTEERLKLLKAIHRIGLAGKPQLERLPDGLYIPAAVGGDSSVYNDLQVSKNVRIASSFEALIGDIKYAAKSAKDLPKEIVGIKFEWTAHHRNFLKDSEYSSQREKMQLLAPLSALNHFAEGNLSALELIHSSILRENGTKITLTSYEPIGAR